MSGKLFWHNGCLRKTNTPRLDDSYCTAEQLKQDNHRILDGYISNGEHITLITENYDDSIRGILY